MSEPISLRVIWCCGVDGVCNKCSGKVFEMVQSCKLFSRRPLTPPPFLSLFFVRSFVNVGAKMFTRRAVQTGTFFPVTPCPPHPPPETGPLHSTISGHTQTSIPQCISTSLPPVAFKPHRHIMNHDKLRSTL